MPACTFLTASSDQHPGNFVRYVSFFVSTKWQHDRKHCELKGYSVQHHNAPAFNERRKQIHPIVQKKWNNLLNPLRPGLCQPLAAPARPPYRFSLLPTITHSGASASRCHVDVDADDADGRREVALNWLYFHPHLTTLHCVHIVPANIWLSVGYR